MKFYKYSLIAALALSGALSACDDDVKYSEVAPTPGVFFPVGENISKLTIEPEAGSFDIEVARYGFTEAQTYTFVNNFKEGEFSMPSTVSFAAEEMTATVTVSYNGATLDYGTYNLEIGFAADQPVNKFGETALKIAVTLPEPTPFVAWKDLGECTYTDVLVTSGLYETTPLKYKVHIEESGETAGLYRLVAPYGTAFADAWKEAFDEELPAACYDSKNELYLVINATNPKQVYIQPQLTGVTLDSDGQMLITNVAGYLISAGAADDVEAGDYGEFADGVIKIPNKNILVNFPFADDEIKSKLYYGNSVGTSKMVVMPGVNAGDFSAEVEYMGQFNNVNTGVVSAIANFTFGADVAAAKAAIVRASSGESVASQIAAGTYADAVDVDITDPVVALPMTIAGTHTIVVVTYDDGGQAQDQATVTFDVNFYNDDAAWNDLGDATFADGWILGFFGVDVTQYAYSVAAQESKNNPGLYRLKNPWAPTLSPIGSFNTDPEQADLYIDARNPECIVIMPQYTGFNNNAGDEEDFGKVFVANLEGRYADLGLTAEEIIAEDAITTTFEDGLFTVAMCFSTGTGPFYQNKWYYNNSQAMILLPEPEEGEEGEEEAPAAIAPSNRPINAAALRPAAFHTSFKLARKSNNGNSRHAKNLNSKSDFQMK